MVDFGNIQGTVRYLYRRPISRHLLFRFGERDGARAFLRSLSPHVTTADLDVESAPDPLLNLGLSCTGLETLGIDPALLGRFAAPFRLGPDPRLLGDVGESAPSTWWEGQFPTTNVHCVVHLYVRTDEALENASELVRGHARDNAVTEMMPRQDGTVLDARLMSGPSLHFGYRDGITQPDIRWDDEPGTPGNVDFRNFVLGYSTQECFSAPHSGAAADLARDSSYAAFRWLYQDVAAFNAFLQIEGPRLFPDLAPADAEELLAAKLMGRWRNGTPLVLSPDRPDESLVKRDDFTFAADDPDGHACPFSAHIRVVNPRDTPLDPAVMEGVPPVLRRGMPYGPRLEGTVDDGRDRGLVGMFLCADLRRQVYTLTGWIKQNTFSPVYNANRRVQDALAGNRAQPGTSSEFRIPGPDGTKVVRQLPDFVRTKGTAFLLHPSKSTLEQLCV